MSVITKQSDSLREFTLWALAQLGAYADNRAAIYHANIPPAYRHCFGERQKIVFTFDSTRAAAESLGEPELVTFDSPLFHQIVDLLQTASPAVNARPSRQPESVREIAERLLPAYKIEGGHVHLGGCSLVDRPFLRVTFAAADCAVPLEGPIVHVYIDPTGEIVSEELVALLGMQRLRPYVGRLPRLAGDELTGWIRTARQQAAAQYQAPEDVSPLAVAVVWCKFVEGKLSFALGENSEEMNFSGWANEVTPTPLVCRHSGAQTYVLAGTDDGRIAAAEQIEACAISGHRVLRSELVECSATGRRVLPEYATSCPVTTRPILKSELLKCPVCGQQVSPQAFVGSQCRACASVGPVTKDDPRMARLLGEHAGLDRWRNWQLSETATVYVALARGPLRRLLIVADKQTLQPLRVAQGSRFFRGWRTLSGAALDEQLR